MKFATCTIIRANSLSVFKVQVGLCYIAGQFGGIIPGTIYTITDAIEDKVVVPLLYEGRHNIMHVNEKPLDTFFDRVSEPLTEYGKAALKRKFSSLQVPSHCVE